MIPETLTIKGLYSYQEKVEIDFSHLVSGALFGIFGPVGSGKSSILEAITFALYGETERMNKRDKRSYNMMNLKSNELLIDFSFRLSEAERYRFTVHQKRNAKNFEDVYAATRSSYVWTNNEWVPTEKNTDEILGLSYDNFRKTVIIPQGRFQEFLTMGATDRINVLKEIFNLDKFDLYYAVKALLNENKEELLKIEGQLTGLGEVNEEALQAQKADLSSLNEGVEKEKKALEKMNEELAGLRQLKEIEQQLSAAKQKRELLQVKSSEFRDREEKLKKYEDLEKRFRHLLERQTDILRSLKEKTQQFTDVQVKYNAGKSELEKISEKEAAIQPELESIREKEAIAADYLTILKIIGHQNNLQKSNKRLQEGNIHLENILKSREDLAEKEGFLSDALNQLKKQKTEPLIVNEIALWYSEKSRLESGIRLTGLEMERINREYKTHEQEWMDLSGDLLVIELLGENKSLYEAELEKGKQDLREKLIAASSALDEHRARQGLGAFAYLVKEGEACPLCGSTEHPGITHAGEDDEKQEAIEKEISGISQNLENWEKISVNVRNLLQRMDFIRSVYEKEKRGKEEQETQLEILLKSWKWKEFSFANENEFHVFKKEQLDIGTKISGTENELEKARTSIREIEQTSKKYEEEINRIRNEISAAEALVREGKKQLNHLSFSDFEQKEPTDIEQEHMAILERIDFVRTNSEQLTRQKNAVSQSVSELQGSMNAMEKQVVEFRMEEKEIATKIGEKLKESGITDIETVRATLASVLDTEKERQLIDTFRQELFMAEQELAKLGAQKGEKEYDPHSHEEKEANAKEKAGMIEVQIAKAGRLAAEISQTEARIASRKSLFEKKEVLDLRASNLKIMERLFKASGFVNFVSTIYLQELCNRANVRFHRLTRNRLSLVVADDNSFEVIDLLNGGARRSVKTLSGGQMFQASLCLALSLADQIQQYSRSSHNFFFMDEGFGTLDKDSMQIVFDTLKELQKENRIVGVISHVEELQQEIGHYLKVWQDEEGGSHIEGVW